MPNNKNNDEELAEVEVPEDILNDLLEISGVGKTIAVKLYNGNYTEKMSIAVASPTELAADTGIGIATASKIVISARDLCELKYENAYEELKRRKTMERFTTGCNALDLMMGGGIETGSLIEAYGEFRTGKTQLGIQLCVTVQLPKEKGGLNGKALFIDCENTFRPERVLEIWDKYSSILKDREQVLRNIIIAKAYNSQHLTFTVNEIPKIITKHKDRPIRLVVIDSIMKHFRAEYVGRGTLADRQQKLNKVLHRLSNLSIAHNLAIFYPNQVSANPALMFGDPKQPIGGHIMAHASTYRIYLRKAKDNKRIARLVDSPCLPEVEAVFLITENGIEDE